MTRLSVVIATRDRAAPLEACLTALAASFPDDAETIVVADGVPLENSLDTFEEALRLRVVTTAHGGPAAARNRGVAAATGDVVAFVDDDCIPLPGWAAAMAAAATTDPPLAAGGTTVNGLPDNSYAAFSQLILDLVAQHDRDTAGRERFFPANNLAVPAGAFRDLGGFDEAYRTAEDRDFCRRWLDAGYELGRAEGAVVEHRPRLDLAAFMRQYYAYGQGAARYHGSWSGGLRKSAPFHLHLPRLVWPAIRREDTVRGATIAGLVGLWELASLAGYVAGQRA